MTLDLDFQAEVKADIYKTNEFLGVSKDFDVETGNPTAYVTYELQPEARKWGLKYIAVVAKKITCSIEWEVDSSELSDAEKQELINAGGTEYRNETIGGVIEIDTTQKLKDKDWDINYQVEFQNYGGLSIDEVGINLGKMVIYLSSGQDI